MQMNIQLTFDDAVFIRVLRVEMECSYGKIAELFAKYKPLFGTDTSQETGRKLTFLAMQHLNESDWDDEPETRKINLIRPVSSTDIETTGTDVENDRICSIAITRITTDLKLQSMYTLVNPGVPIPPAATAIHGITDEMVKDAPFLNMITDEIIGALEGTDILTFNGLKFDMPMLNNEFNRIGYPWDYTRYNHIDAYRIFQKDHPRKLADAHRIYCGEPLNDAHNAKADTEGTAKVFLKQLENPVYPLDMAALQLLLNDNKPMADLSGKFYFNEEGQPCIKFGKHKGKTFDQVKIDDASYFTWILEGNFPTDSKNFLKSILK